MNNPPVGNRPPYNAQLFDNMIRQLGDMGRLPVEPILACGIKAGRVLEIGCGPGWIGLEWLRHTDDAEYVGVDFDPDMIAMAQRNREEVALDKGLDLNRTAFLTADAMRLPFEDNSFDAAFSYNTLHEVSDPAAMLREIHRVVKPEGAFLIRDMHRGGDWTTLEFAQSMERLDDIRRMVGVCLEASFNEEEFNRILGASPLTGRQRFIKAMCLAACGRVG